MKPFITNLSSFEIKLYSSESHFAEKGRETQQNLYLMNPTQMTTRTGPG